MDWDYRIIRHEGILSIKQVYYDQQGVIYGMSEEDLIIEGAALSDLVTEMKLVAKAFDKPVLELGDRTGDTQVYKKELTEPVPKIDDYLPFQSIELL
jgi:hypothetical protein